MSKELKLGALVPAENKLLLLVLFTSALLTGAGSAFANETWAGGTSSDWNTAANWSAGRVPGSGDNITIPSGLSRYPVVSAAGAVCSQVNFSGTTTPAPSLTIASSGSLVSGGNLTMVSGATIIIHSGGTFTLNADCNNPGVGLLDMDGGTFVFNGNNLFIPASLTGGTVDIIHSNPHVGITNFYNLAYSGGSPAFKLAGNTTLSGNLDIASGSQIALNGFSVAANTLTVGSTTQTAGAYNNNNDSSYIIGTSTYVTVSAGPAVHLAFLTPPVNTPSGQTMSNMVVQIQDANGNNVAAGNMPITVSLSAGAFASGNTTTNTGTSGSATLNNLMVNTPGSYTMTASASGLANATSGLFTISTNGSGNQGVTAPQLYITKSGGVVTVSWQNVSGWTLQQNSNLAVPGGWSACSGVATNIVMAYLTINSPTGNMFFRLAHP